MSKIVLKDFNLGGIADSKYQGIPNSVAALVGWDIHSEPGILKVNQKLTKESGAVVDDLVKRILPASDGNSYLFGSTNGKIWKRTSSGVYSLVATAAPATGSVGIMDAWERDGYIYYSMQSRLGRKPFPGLADWTDRDDNFATFSNTDADFHPIIEQNLVLYIGDKNYLAKVDGGLFTANALDIKTPLRIKSLGKINTDLLIGTYVNNNINLTEIFRWNTTSKISFSSSDEIPEVGINAFIPTDNFVLVNAGRKGNLYLYNGEKLEPFKRIPGNWTGTNEAIVHPNAVTNLNGLPLFGISNVSGNPLLQGIYSLGGYDRKYPKVLNLEYVISQGTLANLDIGAIAVVGNDILVSWKDNAAVPVAYGVDKLDTTAKFGGAYMESRIINVERSELKNCDVFINYRSLPTGMDIVLKKSVNYGAFSTVTTVNDAKRMMKFAKVMITGAATLQLRIEVVVNGNNAPEIESVEVNLI